MKESPLEYSWRGKKWYTFFKKGGSAVKYWIGALYLMLILCGSIWSACLSWKYDFSAERFIFFICSFCSFWLFALYCFHAVSLKKMHHKKDSVTR
jgi:hypothetical protein